MKRRGAGWVAPLPYLDDRLLTAVALEEAGVV
jgi:hypothetical protein